ncbi:MAG: acyltransferase [Gammaproteobacteria bacterium]|nr:acyltransferase [Gammaproteobacteria bacterium]
MFKKIKNSVIGVISFLGFALNLIIWIIPVLFFSFIKLIVPFSIIKKSISSLLNWCAERWISVNSLMAHFHLSLEVKWPEELEFSRKDWYLVMANHQSWVDIYILQNLFNRKIPFLKFFLKKELIYVPLLGVAWWALDFPFMKRHSKSYLKKYPHKKGQDLETTKKACEKFKHIPISVMNFVEGTRFTPSKAKRQNTPYNNLLKPKSGGIGTVLSILGQQMHTVLDITLFYENGPPTFWEFLCGKTGHVKVMVRQIQVSPDLIGDMSSPETRVNVQNWLNGIWQSKDQQLQAMAK